MKSQTPDIVFVYKAESGLLNMLKDAVHKTFSPSTYPCKLCDVTYSPVGMRSKWKRFIEQLPRTVEFSYIDLIEKAHPDASLQYPCVCLRSGNQLTPWLSADQINACDSIDALIELVNSSLRDSDPSPDTASLPDRVSLSRATPEPQARRE